MIKIGIFLNTNYGADENVAVRFREAAEQVRMARDYGFASCAWASTSSPSTRSSSPCPCSRGSPRTAATCASSPASCSSPLQSRLRGGGDRHLDV